MSGTGRRVRRAIAPRTTAAQAAVCIAFGAFVLARAIRVSLTYDEAAAYIRYIAPTLLPEFDAGPLAVFNFEVATNHFLSTALTKLAVLVAGSSELSLRLPALVGYAMYLWFSTSLLRRLTSPAIALAGLLLLNLNPYLLEFFALSRGYGLAIGLMMGALHFFLRGRLAPTLVFALAAVLANFTMLDVYLGLVALIIVALRSNRLTVHAAARPRRRPFVLLSVVAPIYAALVFSQDARLSPSLYQPVTVTFEGLGADDLPSTRLWRVDLRGRSARVTDAGPFRAVRVQMPGATADKLRRIGVVVGNHAFSSRPDDPRSWVTRDIGGMREFESGPSISAPRSHVRAFAAVINWAGDDRYAAALARATAISAGVLLLFAVVLNVAGKPLDRARLVDHRHWHTLSLGLLWTAALAGPPLYLLKRDAQLYFGGTRGLIQDTFYSLIESSFYGRAYHAAQTEITFALLVGIVVTFVAIAARAARSRATGSFSAAAQMAGLFAVVSATLVAQHWLSGTVYLAGRTALFFIPLYLLFLIFFCQWLTDIGGVATIGAAAILIVAVTASAYHFAHSANLRYTLDWRADADTRTMIDDVEGIVSAGARGSTTAVAVDWAYAPAATYYAHRHSPVDVDIVVAPSARRPEFLYVDERNAGSRGRVLVRYPVARAVLLDAR